MDTRSAVSISYHLNIPRSNSRVARSLFYTSITIIVSPYLVSLYDHRVGSGPLRILSHGLTNKLEALVPIFPMNIGLAEDFESEIGRTFDIIRRTPTAVSQAVKANPFPMVFSGNYYANPTAGADLNASSRI
ncbi:hypothetical protein CORC01_00588 [Colletotrichum orchidophilum]|uniref:Uncharacterized protein n=1 Tax=Colletotrichum orchidophilum TaxID=1209926 RepID=A0A1G4BS31_9PEZI|nr:uncharacterized protein CORC01_00588 [Colletotrichum orchidophilum]OHF04249.1 hypothetical protein CORC01_00588 [Colletotrichum orchidophilum]